MDGYLDNPEENAKTFQEGWFKTGDIGLFDATGQPKIIDHKKNLVKTLNAERGVYRIGESDCPCHPLVCPTLPVVSVVFFILTETPQLESL